MVQTAQQTQCGTTQFVSQLFSVCTIVTLGGVLELEGGNDNHHDSPNGHADCQTVKDFLGKATQIMKNEHGGRGGTQRVKEQPQNGIGIIVLHNGTEHKDTQKGGGNHQDECGTATATKGSLGLGLVIVICRQVLRRGCLDFRHTVSLGRFNVGVSGLEPFRCVCHGVVCLSKKVKKVTTTLIMVVVTTTTVWS